MSEIFWERRECVSAEVEQSLVLLDLNSLLYHSLNRTAAAIWGSLAEPHSAPEIVIDLCSRFDVTPEHCQASVDRLLEQLSAAGLIAPHPKSAGAVNESVGSGDQA